MPIAIRLTRPVVWTHDAPHGARQGIRWEFRLEGVDGFRFDVHVGVRADSPCELLTGTAVVTGPMPIVRFYSDGQPRASMAEGACLARIDLRRGENDNIDDLATAIGGRRWTDAAIDAFPQEWVDAALTTRPASAPGGLAAAEAVLRAISTLSPAGPVDIRVYGRSADATSPHDPPRCRIEDLRTTRSMVVEAGHLLGIDAGCAPLPYTPMPLVVTSSLYYPAVEPSAHQRLAAIATLTRWLETDAPYRADREDIVVPLLTAVGAL